MTYKVSSPSESFIELLSGKSPEAMYDVLYAGRYLSDAAIQSPAVVLEDIKATVFTYQQRAFLSAKMVERIARLLANSDYLSEKGMRLYRGEGD